MKNNDHQRELIALAVAGDRLALQKLLVAEGRNVERYAAGKLPTALNGKVDASDITQQTFLEAFSSVGRFRVELGESFRAWLFGIADHVIKDAVKHVQRVKRGGQFQHVRTVAPTASCSVAVLVELLSADSHSPSYSVMGHEAVQAVEDAIAALPDDYRLAVRLRLLEGKSLEETAQLMDRTPGAVQGLIDRAKKTMRGKLGRLSKYR